MKTSSQTDYDAAIGCNAEPVPWSEPGIGSQDESRPKTILCVDDSPTELRLMRNALSDKGYLILVATDGEEALRQVTVHSPDLILLDIILPKKNGFQVCRQVKTAPDTKHIRVILVSSKSKDTDRFWGLTQGADDYVTKPFRPEDVSERVSRQLARAVSDQTDKDGTSGRETEDGLI